MTNKARVFISYKTGPDTGLTFQANMVRQWLEAAGYDVWWDAVSLRAGENWNEQIFKEIPERDVLVLLLASETAHSDWVCREVDIARATRVAVLPVRIRGDFDLMGTLQKFDISYKHSLSLEIGTNEEFKKIRKGIEQLYENNRRRRAQFLASLGDKPGLVHEPIKKLHRFQIKNRKTKVFIAAGDFLEMKGFDAIVNTENDHMQMARIFEAKTISSLLRYHGSELDEFGRIVNDTVQDEIDSQLKDSPRPVVKGTVIVTSAGHEASRLRSEIGVRYILHAATVKVEGDGPDKDLVPVRSPSAIKRIVTKVLKRADECDDDGEPPRSIYVPLFGTGRGGLKVEEVATPMARGVRDFVLSEKNHSLKQVYLGAYFEDDVEPLLDALRKEFKELKSKRPRRGRR